MENTNIHIHDASSKSTEYNRFYNLMNAKAFKIKLPKVNFDGIKISKDKDELN